MYPFMEGAGYDVKLLLELKERNKKEYERKLI